MCRSSRMSGRKSAMPPSDSMLKPWQNTTRVTVSAASCRPTEAGEEDLRDTGLAQRKAGEDSGFAAGRAGGLELRTFIFFRTRLFAGAFARPAGFLPSPPPAPPVVFARPHLAGARGSPG